MKIGVVGYSHNNIDKEKALKLIKEAFDLVIKENELLNEEIEIVSGLTALGIPLLAYEEAKRRNWKTTGIACKLAYDYECFDVDKKEIVGDKWGDESKTFINYIDVLIRIGGGKQSKEETKMMKILGKKVYEFELECKNEESPIPEKIFRHFIYRNNSHISLVQDTIDDLLKIINIDGLKKRGEEHDKSKSSVEEVYAYIWLSWRYYCERTNNKFVCPDKGIDEKINNAWNHHKTFNRHHPEFFGLHLENMEDVDLAEMVCDCVAVGRELNNSAKDYITKNHFKEFNFSNEQKETILKYLDILEKNT